MNEVSLHGVWASPFSCRVVWALKLKGIPYTYIEEDLRNKSDHLLLYNPVHKKVPVLLHRGRSVCESMIIVQYLDDTWPDKPLLPRDPYERALSRFWVKFAEDKGPTIWKVFSTTGEEQEKAKTEFLEMLRTIEDEALGDHKKFFGGEEIGMVDIAFGWLTHWFEAIQEILEVKLLEAHEFPCLHSWIHNFKQVPSIKENLPPYEGLVSYFRQLRAKFVT